MKIKNLYDLYYSTKNKCCKCGCELEDLNDGLGSVFVLDKEGNFYCINCDKDFTDGDERIFDADLYPKIQVHLWCGDTETDVLYAYAPKEEIKDVLCGTRHLIDIWLGDEEGEIPDNYEWCSCDEDFYIEALNSNFETEYEGYDDRLDFDY